MLQSGTTVILSTAFGLLLLDGNKKLHSYNGESKIVLGGDEVSHSVSSFSVESGTTRPERRVLHAAGQVVLIRNLRVSISEKNANTAFVKDRNAHCI